MPPDTLCDLCLMLEDEAAAVGGEFDGWACGVAPKG